MKTIKINKDTFNLKSSFSELTEKELQVITYILKPSIFGSESDQIKFNADRMNLFQLLSNVPEFIILHITADQWVDILPALNYIFKFPDFMENPYPSINFRLKKFYGPTGMMDKCSSFEISAADTAFINFHRTKKIEFLHQLFAILYRPVRSDLYQFYHSEQWNGDVREPYNSARAKYRQKNFAKINQSVLLTIYLFYWCFRENFMLKKFPNLFSGSSISGQTTNSWPDILLEAAHLSIFGDIDKVGTQNWYTVLYELDKQLTKAKKI